MRQSLFERGVKMAVEILKDRFTIGNDFVSKTYRLEKGRLTSFLLTNVLTGKAFAPAAGSELFVLHFAGAFGGEIIKASDLKVQDALPTEDAFQSTIKIFFKPVRVRGSKIELQYAETLQKTDSFFTAHLEIRGAGSEKAVLDYLDFAPLRLAGSEKVCAVQLPEKRKDASFVSLLGQPVFVDHAFFGCMFPASLNTVADNSVWARRYYGRSLAALCGESGLFVSDQVICGVAPKSDLQSVRGAFLRALEKLVPPAQTQNVLWFPSSPLEKEAETELLAEDKRMQQAGTRFFDSVLLDQRLVYPDESPFTFPEQVPLGLRNFAATAAALGASLGMAVGLPTRAKGLFRKKEAHGDVCLADEGMLAAFRAFVLSLCAKCGVTDWQIFLPLERACREKTHVHPLGGERQLYYYSDVYEKWINCLCQLKKSAARQLRFSLCGGALSPWLLQWVDCLALPQKEETRRDEAYFEAFSAGICVPPERLFLPAPANETPFPFPYTAAKRTLLLSKPADPAVLLQLWRRQGSLAALLRRTVLFGDPSGTSGYGFAAFDSGEGLLTLRNPNPLPLDLTLTLDEALGVPPRFLCVGAWSLLPLTACISNGTLRFGDHLTQTLEPYETRVLHLGCRQTPAEPSQDSVAAPRDEKGLLAPGALSGTGAFSIKATFGSEQNLQMYLQTERLQLFAADGHITFKVGDAVLRSVGRTDDVVQVCAVRESSGTLKLYLNGKLDSSMVPITPPVCLVPAAPLCFDEKRTKLYAKALAFDEV